MNTQNQITVNVKRFGSDWENIRGEYMSLYDNGYSACFYFTEVEGQYSVSSRDLQLALFNTCQQGYLDGLVVEPRGSRHVMPGNGWVGLLFEAIVYCEGLSVYNVNTRRIIGEIQTAIGTGLLCPVDNMDDMFPNGAWQSPNFPDYAFGYFFGFGCTSLKNRIFHIPTQKYYDF